MANHVSSMTHHHQSASSFEFRGTIRFNRKVVLIQSKSRSDSNANDFNDFH